MTSRYDLQGSTTIHSALQDKFATQLLATYFDELKSGSSVIEIGPGKGHFANACRTAGFRYVGIEPSEILGDELVTRGFEIKRAEVPPVPAQDETYDLFYAGMVLEHMSSHIDAAKLLEEAFRVLKPGGALCLFFPNAYAAGRVFWEMDYSHGYFTSPRRVLQLSEQTGFRMRIFEQAIGWYWVKSKWFHHCMRLMAAIPSALWNTHLVTQIAACVGLESALWKVRKTVFESTLLILTKPSD